MYSRYDTYFVNELKKRNNNEQLFAVIGSIISVNPITVSLFNGKATYSEGNNAYVCESLKSTTGTIILDGQTKDFTMTRELNVNDSVLCIPLVDGQKYAIIDRV